MFQILYATPYADGPIASVAQSLAIVGTDSTGDGFAFTDISLDTRIDGNVVHTMNVSDCTLAPGGAGTSVGCNPSGDQFATLSQAISEPSTGADLFSTTVKTVLSPGDMFIATYYASLLGLTSADAPISTHLTGSIAFQNLQAIPVQFNFLFATPAAAGRYTQANLNFAGSVLDLEGDGASADIDVSMSLGTVLLSLGIQDTCSVNNGLLAGTICRGGTGFTPEQFAANGPNFGFVDVVFKGTLSGNGDSAAFQAATTWSESEPVPEPSTTALVFGGIGVLLLLRRGRAR